MTLEVIVQSVADARAAEAGGADRLEVVREIDRDGLTPSIDLVREIASMTSLPLRVMVRESDGFSVTGPGEIDTMRRAVEALAALAVDGVVVGFTRNGRLDLETIHTVLSAAPAVAVTLHRAFDNVGDPFAAIDDVHRSLPQVDRILTGGGTGDWQTRARRLQDYARRAGDRPIILAGGDVDEAALRLLAATRTVGEAHVGRAARELKSRSAPVSAECVRRLKFLIPDP